MNKIVKWLGASLLAFSSILTHADTLNLDQYKGKVVYVDFWASWCGPCRESFPWMKKMQQQYGKDGLVIIAVNVDQDKKLADKFLTEFKPEFSVVIRMSHETASLSIHIFQP